MPRNVELKARVRDEAAVLRRIHAIRDTSVQHLQQEDTFFWIPSGRLKLRRFPDGHGELIFYARADEEGASTSRYAIYRTANPEGVLSLLRSFLEIRGVVRKHRLLCHQGRTRIHLDHVEDLGCFLELEVVLGDEESEEGGRLQAEHLATELGVPADDRIAVAYIDLLEGKTDGAS